MGYKNNYRIYTFVKRDSYIQKAISKLVAVIIWTYCWVRILTFRDRVAARASQGVGGFLAQRAQTGSSLPRTLREKS